MEKVKISAVSYLNSKPFIFGLQNHTVFNSIDLTLDIPSVCAQKLLSNEVDLGLIPVAIIPELKESYILSDYCIAADGKVESVMLYSQVPLSNITTILLDYQSRTSVKLVQLLASKFWNIKPIFVSADTEYINQISDNVAAVVIGDRTFELNGNYKYEFDLAEEWKKFSGLPFVFACWVANKKLTDTFVNEFNDALGSGVKQKELVIESLKNQYPVGFNSNQYLNKSIHFDFSSDKKKGLELFLQYLSSK